MSVIAAAYSSYTSLVDFADQHRGSGCRHQGQHGKRSTGIVIGVRRLGHHGQHLVPRQALLARASAEQSVVDRLQAQLDAFQHRRVGGSASRP